MASKAFRVHEYIISLLDYRKPLVSQLSIEDIVTCSLQLGYQLNGFRLSPKAIGNGIGKAQELHKFKNAKRIKGSYRIILTKRFNSIVY